MSLNAAVIFPRAIRPGSLRGSDLVVLRRQPAERLFGVGVDRFGFGDTHDVALWLPHHVGERAGADLGPLRGTLSDVFGTERTWFAPFAWGSSALPRTLATAKPKGRIQDRTCAVVRSLRCEMESDPESREPVERFRAMYRTHYPDVLAYCRRRTGRHRAGRRRRRRHVHRRVAPSRPADLEEPIRIITEFMNANPDVCQAGTEPAAIISCLRAAGEDDVADAMEVLTAYDGTQP